MSLKNKFKTFFSLEDDYEYVEEEPQSEEREEIQRNQENRNNVISLQAVQSSSKVVLCEPRAYSEVQEIADHIVNRRAVVINLQMVEHAEAKQIVDFLSGTVYALSGKIQKLGSQTFLCTPENIDVSGTISEQMVEEDIEKRW